jgi:hypothetical protein
MTPSPTTELCNRQAEAEAEVVIGNRQAEAEVGAVGSGNPPAKAQVVPMDTELQQS